MAIDDTPEFSTIDAPGPADRPAPRVRLDFAAESHPGKVRPNNEDQFLVATLAKSMRIRACSLQRPERTRYSDEEGHLLIVADGMGGSAAGEQASELAIRTVEEFVLDTLKWFLHLGRQEESALRAELRQALEQADRTVMERAWADPRLAGMGTTLTMAYSVAADLFLVHAGDTRAYLHHDGHLDRLTSDHTLVQLLVDSGQLTPEAARHHRRRHVVTNIIGGPRPGVHAEILKVGLRDGDVLLLCSDGLTEALDDAVIAATLAEAPDPRAACDRLLALALDAGAPDNVTIIVARYAID